MSFRQLTLEERYQIQIYLAMKLRCAAIARMLGRHRSTILRELRRNRIPDATHPYLAKRADRMTQNRRVEQGRCRRRIQGPLRLLIEQKLRLSWSPEQISGRLRTELGIRISHETIYQHVLRDSAQRGFLRYCLRFGGYKHHRFKKSKCAERTRLRKNWLCDRPAGANQRTEIGHWERDCLLGKRGNSVLLTVIDRHSRFTRIRHVKRLTAKEVSAATQAVLRNHRHVTKTITNDNGTEFQRDESLQKQLGIPIFFTDPASPWQRGSIENLNGLIRQYIPKSANLDALPSHTAQALEDTLNFRPRKILNFKTPHEVFFNQNVRLADGLLLRFGLEFNA